MESSSTHISNTQIADKSQSDDIASNHPQDMDAARIYLDYVSALLDSLKDSVTSRSNILLAANGTIIGILLLIITSDSGKQVIDNCIVIALLCVTLFFLIMSLYYTLAVIRVFKPSNIDSKERMHFRVILKLGEKCFKQFVLSINQDILIDEFVTQILALSRHLERRYEYLYRAFCFFMICLSSFFVAVIYISIIIIKK
jgi:uncharacterized membrane protein